MQKISKQTFILDRRYYYQVVRALLMNKSDGIYFFNEDLDGLLKPQANNRVVIDNPTVAGVKLTNCYFELSFSDDAVIFDDFDRYDACAHPDSERYVIDYEGAENFSGPGRNATDKNTKRVLSFEQIMEKYLTPIPKELEKYLDVEVDFGISEDCQSSAADTSTVELIRKNSFDLDNDSAELSDKEESESSIKASRHTSFLKRNTMSAPSLQATPISRFSLRARHDSPPNEQVKKERGSRSRFFYCPKKNRSDPSLLKREDSAEALKIDSKKIVEECLVNPSYILEVFNQFNQKKSQAVVQFLKSLAMNYMMKLFNKQDKPLGDNVINVMSQCFDCSAYNATRDDFLVCFNVLIYYMRIYKCLPEFFCENKASYKFLLKMTAEEVSTFVSVVREIGYTEVLRLRILDRLVSHDEAGFVVKLLSNDDWQLLAVLLKGKDPIAYYFSLLKQETKKVDLALLAQPEFIEFIDTQRDTAVGSLVYAQLLQRIKSAFDYSNLPDSYSEVRQTSAGSQLLVKNRDKVNRLHQCTMLSFGEVVRLFMTLKPINKLKFGEIWLKHYQENLALIMKNFLPHLPAHLHEVAELYVEYQRATIGITASLDKDRYNPKRHTRYPAKIIQYLNPEGISLKNLLAVSKAVFSDGSSNVGMSAAELKELPIDLQKFIANLRKLSELYKKMADYDTVRMNGNELVGFVSTNRVAEKIVAAVIGQEAVTEARTFDDDEVGMMMFGTTSDSSESHSRKASLVDREEESSDSMLSSSLKKIRGSLPMPSSNKSVNANDLASWISEAIVNCCQQRGGSNIQSNLYTSTTAENVLEHGQILWLKSYLVPELEARLLESVDTLKVKFGNKFSMAFDKKCVSSVVEEFFADNIATNFPGLK